MQSVISEKVSELFDGGARANCEAVIQARARGESIEA